MSYGTSIWKWLTCLSRWVSVSLPFSLCLSLGSLFLTDSCLRLAVCATYSWLRWSFISMRTNYMGLREQSLLISIIVSTRKTKNNSWLKSEPTGCLTTAWTPKCSKITYPNTFWWGISKYVNLKKIIEYFLVNVNLSHDITYIHTLCLF